MQKIEPRTFFRGRKFANIDFEDGVLYYQGENDDQQNELDCDETKELFLAMMNNYIARGDKFWVKKEKLNCPLCDCDITNTVNSNIYHGER
jgi:hypothetical protein